MQESINNLSMLKVGTILRGTYRIDSYLSSGGFGNTYVATNIEFDERVAIKEFFMKGVTQRDDNQTTVGVSNSENYNSFLEQKEKFKKEARRIRQLKNEHIVAVHDLFEENGTAYYVMDYVDGENLSDRLKRTGKPMTEQEVREILPQILNALKSVHDTGIWHLDLKPANIMVDKAGSVKLIDFGASKQLNAQKGGATTSTAISYTNGYAPREQMEQNYDKFGPWTDIYALGATLYNLLTNKRPPLPTDIDDDISEDKHEALPFPDSVSDDMKFLVLRMLNTNRMQRPQNIADITSTEVMSGDTTQSLKQQAAGQYANDDETTIILSPIPSVKELESEKDTENNSNIIDLEVKNELHNPYIDLKDGIIALACGIFVYILHVYIMGNPNNFVGGDTEGYPANYLGEAYKGGFPICLYLFVTLSTIIVTIKHFLPFNRGDFELEESIQSNWIAISVSVISSVYVHYCVFGNPDNFIGGDVTGHPANALGVYYKMGLLGLFLLLFFFYSLSIWTKALYKAKTQNRVDD